MSGQISSWKAVPFFTRPQNQSPALITAWNQDIATLCISGWSNRIFCWDLSVEKFAGTVFNSSSSPMTSMYFNESTNVLVCCTYSGHLGIVDFRTHVWSDYQSYSDSSQEF